MNAFIFTQHCALSKKRKRLLFRLLILSLPAVLLISFSSEVLSLTSSGTPDLSRPSSEHTRRTGRELNHPGKLPGEGVEAPHTPAPHITLSSFGGNGFTRSYDTAVSGGAFAAIFSPRGGRRGHVPGKRWREKGSSPSPTGEPLLLLLIGCVLIALAGYGLKKSAKAVPHK